MSFIGLCEHMLPLNRKERYYTGTVFPALVCAENFKYFDRFLALLNHGGEFFDVSTDNVNIQFFTEYGLFDSLFSDKKARFKEFFPDTLGTRDICQRRSKIASFSGAKMHQ